ncbi:arylacetamide deacetylase-like 4 isoform X2 [Betta splendens]|uniref:Arylacetamide deacetylase-like 4 isoform X2 n=1 Tax=Betta splendens TaxID=158456 RepID=A0A9W2XSJ5_BETSP|nr:arylacetamide deacetylase-like 4 isoform X2 [Betta splendens]
MSELNLRAVSPVPLDRRGHSEVVISAGGGGRYEGLPAAGRGSDTKQDCGEKERATGRILHRLGVCHQISFIRWFVARHLLGSRPVPAGLRVKDLQFCEVPVRVYEPTSVRGGLRRGLVYFHGGGWVLGSIDSVDEVCRYLAQESDSTVVSVGYRLAPEHRYPAPLDDCQAATCHFLSAAEAEFGVDPRRVAVGGDGAGANLAAALCQRLARAEDGHLPSPRAQILLYPALQMADFNLPSYQQNHAVPILFRGRMAFYFLQYLSGDVSLCQDVLEGNHVPTELRPRYKQCLCPSNLPSECLARGFRERPRPEFDGEAYHAVRAGLEAEVSPLLAADAAIQRSPPTFILTCEYDVLRDEGLLYRKRLLDLNVDVTWQHVPDGVHGVLNFFRQRWLGFPCAQGVVDGVVSYLKSL